VSPNATDAEITNLENQLGRAPGRPPFPAGPDKSATSGGFVYTLQVGNSPTGAAAIGITVKQAS